MVKKLILVLGFLLTINCLEKCYHTKCKTTYGTYVDCNQRYYRCISSTISPCQYRGTSSYDGYETCWSNQICTNDYYTGRAKCTDTTDIIETGLGIVKWIIIAVAVVVFVGIVICCLCCYCMGKLCFKNKRNQGRVINSQPVTYNQPAGAVQTTYVPGQSNNLKAAQSGPAGHSPAQSKPTYPPGQYPPAQYPPAQYPPGQYPPSQSPAQYPPAQYPPAQYPPAQYPPSQYPPTTQYPPSGGGYSPAPGGAYPPASGAYPPASGAYPPQPPPYAAQPPENPYMKS